MSEREHVERMSDEQLADELARWGESMALAPLPDGSPHSNRLAYSVAYLCEAAKRLRAVSAGGGTEDTKHEPR